MKGDVPGHPLAYAVRPNYGMLLIERWTLAVTRKILRNGACPEVGTKREGMGAISGVRGLDVAEAGVVNNPRNLTAKIAKTAKSCHTLQATRTADSECSELHL